MKTKNILLGIGLGIILYAIISSFTNLTGSHRIKGNGKVVSEQRKINSFHGLEAGGIFQIYYRQGDSLKLVVETDENILPEIKTKVKDGILELETKGNLNDITKLNIYITSPVLDYVNISGASHFTTKGRISSNTFNLEASGAAQFISGLRSKETKIEASGATDIELHGSTKILNIEVSGAAHFKGSDFYTEVVNADASGASHIKLNVGKQLKAEASGAAHIFYISKGKIVTNLSTSGAASIASE